MLQNRKGQIKMSVNMIFSIFLIAVFIVVAIIAVMSFLDITPTIETGMFIDDLQNQINFLWSSPGGDVYGFENRLDSDVDYVCFVDIETPAFGDCGNIDCTELYNELNRKSSANLYFYPRIDVNPPYTYIENINLTRITETRNPYCIENDNGNIKMILEKDIGEALVTITEV